MNRNDVASWLKVLVFLVLVMGLTWILGVLVLNVPALLPLAYIYTTVVAFQGLAIFLSLVVFQQPVRNECIKWWKNKIQSSDLLSKSLIKSSKANTLSSTVKVSAKCQTVGYQGVDQALYCEVHCVVSYHQLETCISHHILAYV